MQDRAKGRRAGPVVARETSAAGPGASAQGLRLGSQLSVKHMLAGQGMGGEQAGSVSSGLTTRGRARLQGGGGDLTSPWPLKQNAQLLCSKSFTAAYT